MISASEWHAFDQHAASGRELIRAQGLLPVPERTHRDGIRVACSSLLFRRKSCSSFNQVHAHWHTLKHPRCRDSDLHLPIAGPWPRPPRMAFKPYYHDASGHRDCRAPGGPAPARGGTWARGRLRLRPAGPSKVAAPGGATESGFLTSECQWPGVARSHGVGATMHIALRLHSTTGCRRQRSGRADSAEACPMPLGLTGRLAHCQLSGSGNHDGPRLWARAGGSGDARGAWRATWTSPRQ